jgi:hypothetical protein
MLSDPLVAALITLTGAITAAFIGLIGKFLYDLRLARRKDRLERINAQLRNLFGPLYATDLVARELWLTFRKTYRTSGSYFSDTSPPTEEEKKTWRLWMTTVFMPLNERMETVVTANADQVPETDMPSALLLLSSHIHAYKPVIGRWAEGDFSEHRAPIPYPAKELREYIHGHYSRLKAEQANLLGSR